MDKNHYIKCPFRYKYQLVSWACRKWPDEKKNKFQKMDKKQLYAIFYQTKAEVIL